MAKGKFLVFEGGEFVGKTSQIVLLADKLKQCGVQTVVTKEPGGTPLGLKLRERLLAGGLTPDDEVALFMEDRRIHVAEVLRPARERGEFVLCDRFSDSTFAYQHFGRGLDRGWLEREDAQARGGIAPDLVILLDMPPERAFLRAGARGEEFTSFEREGMKFHKRVRGGFLALARESVHNYEVINADAPKDEVAEKIWQVVQKRFLL